MVFSGSDVDRYDKDGGHADLKTDALESDIRILFPGRFYVLRYMSEDKKKPFNTRPFIISLGLSKKDPESFLCVDLCVMPRNVRMRFLEKYFGIFGQQIGKEMSRYTDVKDADRQGEIRDVTYSNLLSVRDFEIIKPAIKRYRIKNTLKIYSVLFGDVYMFAGNFADEDWFENGSISGIQNDFLKKITKWDRW